MIELGAGDHAASDARLDLATTSFSRAGVGACAIPVTAANAAIRISGFAILAKAQGAGTGAMLPCN